ncbi:hypothetical protein BT93_E1763 [Corymbia citriodora subsp. variegata]|nr:hypothetical protein BT93_E1763 [Corymbia citriodora subsp. variegata]
MRDALSCLLRVFPLLMRLYSRDVWVPARRRSADYRRSSGSWTFEENRRFENCLAVYGDEVGPSSTSYEGFPQRFAHEFPGKSVEQIHWHLQALLLDLQLIESGSISFPKHWMMDSAGKGKRKVGDSDSSGSSLPSSSSTSSSSSDASIAPCRKWTGEEHERFLRGMNIYGKGDWNRISANVVFTKSPSQLERHAEEHFSSKDSPTSPKRRRIIYDRDDDEDNKP